jgi:Protein of unknown function (DUF2795)
VTIDKQSIDIFNYNIDQLSVYMETSSSKGENIEQIPKEDDPQGKTGKVISEQSGVEGQRKEVNVESYSEVAIVGQILKDLEFPTNKNKIIEYINQQSNVQNKEEILEKLQKLEEREYKNVSDITTAAGLVY